MGGGAVIQAIGNGLPWYGFTIFFLPITRDLGLTHAATSLIFSAARLEGGIAGPAGGFLIDRLGPRKVSVAAVLLVGFGYILLSRIQDFASLFIVYVLVISIGSNSGFFQAISASVNSWFIRRRALAMAITSAASSVGGFFLVPPLAALIAYQGWRFAAVVVGILVLLTLPASFLLYASPESRGLRPDGDAPPESVPSRRAARIAAGIDFTVREALRTRAYWLLALAVAARMMVTNGVVVHMVPILVWKGMDEGAAAYMVSVFALISIGTRLASGWIGDRVSKTLLCAIGTLIGFFGLLVLLVAGSAEMLYLFVLCQAFTEGTIPINWVLVGDFFGRRTFATLRGIMAMIYSLGVFISPIYAGWIFDNTGGYVITIWTFCALLGLSVLTFLMLKHPAPPARG